MTTWTIGEPFEIPTSIDWAEIIIYGDDGDAVAAVVGNLAYDITAQEMAEKIVRAVNCHDDLVKALETLVAIVGLTAFKYEEQRQVLQEAVDKATKAVAKAKAQPEDL